MKPNVILLDGWPLVEKACGVRNFTESLIQTIDKNHKDISLHIAIPVFSGFENQFHYENLLSLKDQYKNTTLHEFHIQGLFLALLEAASNLLGIKKKKTLARFIWHKFFFSQLVKQLRPQIVLHPTQEVGPKYDRAFTIGVIHDTFSFEHDAILKNINFIDRLFYRYMYRKVYLNNVKHADLLLTVSDITKIDLNLQYGIAFDKIVTIYEGAHSVFEQFAPDKAQAAAFAEKHKLPKKYILSSNPESYRKYPATILHAFNLLKEKENDIYLVFFGTAQTHTIEEEVIALGLKEKVIFLLSEIPLDDLPYLYYNSQCFVFNTIAEGFGLPILEAMWSQTPVIASTVPPLFEVYKDNIMYIDPFDPKELHALFVQIINDKSQREKIVNKQLQRAQQFTWTKISSVLMPILKGIPHKPQNGSLE